MKISNNIIDLIGNTPLVELKKLEKELNLKARILAKLEYNNPAGSTKDRAAYYMLKDAIENKKIDKNTTIIEPTSGNTGIGLASICAYLGFNLILTMPETMSIERRKLIAAYGAKIVLTDGKLGMKGAIEKANELNQTIKNSFIPSQFENIQNPKAHFYTTGPEIWDDTDGKVDIFLSAVGSGGTITGVGEFLKSKNKNIKIVALEPSNSPVLSKGTSGSHKIQGIGAGFIPKTLNTQIYDEIITAKDEDAIFWARELVKKEGILVGISSGAALYGAIELAKRKENEGKMIVTVFVDNGMKYLSSQLFD